MTRRHRRHSVAPEQYEKERSRPPVKKTPPDRVRPEGPTAQHQMRQKDDQGHDLGQKGGILA